MAKKAAMARKRPAVNEDRAARKITRENARSAMTRAAPAPPIDHAEVERRVARREIVEAAHAIVDAELAVMERWLDLAESVFSVGDDVLNPDTGVLELFADCAEAVRADPDLHPMTKGALTRDVREWLVGHVPTDDNGVARHVRDALELRLGPPAPTLDRVRIGQAINVERGATIAAATAATRRQFHRDIKRAHEDVRRPILSVANRAMRRHAIEARRHADVLKRFAALLPRLGKPANGSAD